jgi:hypothetical protein
MSNQLTHRDFAIRSAGFGLALGLAPAATLAEAEQASRSETSPAVADPYSLVDPLAPETRYLGSLEDNCAALKWVHAHTAELRH